MKESVFTIWFKQQFGRRPSSIHHEEWLLYMYRLDAAHKGWVAGYNASNEMWKKKRK